MNPAIIITCGFMYICLAVVVRNKIEAAEADIEAAEAEIMAYEAMEVLCGPSGSKSFYV